MTGIGQIVSNFGNDSGAVGLLKGKRTETTLRFTLKVGVQKISFNGNKIGDAYIGLAKVKIPPEKGTINLEIADFGGGDPIDRTPPTSAITAPPIPRRRQQSRSRSAVPSMTTAGSPGYR